MGNPQALAERGKRTAAVSAAVVGEQSAHADAVPTEPRERAPEKRRHRGALFVTQHFHVHEPRGVVDRDVDVLPADPADATAGIPGDAMADAPDPPEFLDIQVDELPGMRPFIPA